MVADQRIPDEAEKRRARELFAEAVASDLSGFDAETLAAIKRHLVEGGA